MLLLREKIGFTDREWNKRWKEVNYCCLSHLNDCYWMCGTSFDLSPFIAAACTEAISSWCNLTITHCPVAVVVPLCGGLSIWAGFVAGTLYICSCLILIVFPILCPERFPRTVKPCEKKDSQFLIAHLSCPAAIISTKHWAQSDHTSYFAWLSASATVI